MDLVFLLHYYLREFFLSPRGLHSERKVTVFSTVYFAVRARYETVLEHIKNLIFIFKALKLILTQTSHRQLAYSFSVIMSCRLKLFCSSWLLQSRN